jgi:hypothetical protein
VEELLLSRELRKAQSEIRRFFAAHRSSLNPPVIP